MTHVDKEKRNIAISSLRGFQVRYKYMLNLMSTKIVSKEDDKVIETRIIALTNKFAYTAVVTPKKVHAFGPLDCWAKASVIQNYQKSRPLGSYWCHKKRSLLSLVCKVIMFMLSCLGLDLFRVYDAHGVKCYFDEINGTINTLRSSGKQIEV